MPSKTGVAGSIPGFSIKPLSVSLWVLQSLNKHTNLKPTGQNWFIPRKAISPKNQAAMVYGINLCLVNQGRRFDFRLLEVTVIKPTHKS